ncbi:MAG: hypothetical protein JWO91_870 [Acidobacteriaceae bacterium]|nr:hypothetical protein [Acidobacteriaceae bacterium]
MLRTVIYVLWLAAFVVECVIARQLLIRRLFKEYPLFLAYVIEHIVSFICLFFCFHFGSRVAYRHLYMGWEAVDVVLKLGIIAELFAHVFASYKAIHHLGTTIVRIASVILVLCATVVALLSNIADPNNFLSKFFAMERSVEIVQGGLLFLLFALCYVLALEWKQPSLGIAFGLCIITSVNLAMFTLRAEFGSSSNQIFSLVSNVGYDLGAVTWLLTLYPQRDKGHSVAGTMPELDVSSWNRTLLELLRK